ncbi:hypothetical protein PIB30_075841 [Stylosanthes scabra]|uniref:Uncharacterized protein n=1 Tax=Stylosanthes scabra TaxID=79078 RepID=A0ABU6ZNR8_9FABA|nr:hypothetical protein [Stylosanthes scabra]
MKEATGKQAVRRKKESHISFTATVYPVTVGDLSYNKFAKSKRERKQLDLPGEQKKEIGTVDENDKGLEKKSRIRKPETRESAHDDLIDLRSRAPDLVVERPPRPEEQPTTWSYISGGAVIPTKEQFPHMSTRTAHDGN